MLQQALQWRYFVVQLDWSTTAYIAIGSNLSNPVEQANNAIEALVQHPDIHLVACSSVAVTARQWGHKINPITSTQWQN